MTPAASAPVTSGQASAQATGVHSVFPLSEPRRLMPDVLGTCHCGRPIVDDPLYGWLHLVTERDPSELAAVRTGLRA